jgi:hypothetical protein
MKTAWVALSTAVGLGFGYATLGVLSIIGTKQLGWQLWWLEPVVALGVGLFCFMLCGQVAQAQLNTPNTNRGERAIWRLVYRKRTCEVSLEQIITETMLEEGAALNALRELETKGLAVMTAPNLWLLKA